jgi:hypothetical protein
VASGETEIAGLDGEEAERETADFESLFKLRVSILLESLFASHPDLPTRVVLVPSLNDVFHDHVFPQVSRSVVHPLRPCTRLMWCGVGEKKRRQPSQPSPSRSLPPLNPTQLTPIINPT